MLNTKDNPMRLPEWRWRRAEETVNRRQEPDDVAEDEFMGRASRFLRQRKKLHGRKWQSSARSEALSRDQDPHLFDAYTIWRMAAEYRDALEALIVAGATDADIAQTLGLAEETVTTYVATFYDVRDRLACQLYAMSLFQTVYTDGLTNVTPGIFWKFFGWRCGPELLKAGWRRDDSAELNTVIDELCSQQLALNGLQAALLRGVNSDTSHEVISESPAIARLRNQAPAPAEGKNDRLFRELLGSIQLGIRTSMEPSGPSEEEKASPEYQDAMRRLRGGARPQAEDPAEEMPAVDDDDAARAKKVRDLGRRLREQQAHTSSTGEGE